MAGKVYIVGAGPGSADLLTLRAVALLRAADVVLHDDLVTPEILALIASSAKKISVGKRYGDHHHTQEQINALMVWHANNGSSVVRLKSGDPSIFGRLGEELDALRRAGIEFEIVPGVTAASAAASSAEITLTDRRTASALVVLTAHNCRGDNLRTAGLDPQNRPSPFTCPGLITPAPRAISSAPAWSPIRRAFWFRKRAAAPHSNANQNEAALCLSLICRLSSACRRRPC